MGALSYSFKSSMMSFVPSLFLFFEKGGEW